MRRDAPAGPDQAAKRAGVCWLRPAGTDDATPARLVWHAWYDGAVVVVADEARDDVPLLAGRTAVDGAPAAYVCRGFVCDRPVTDPAGLPGPR